MASANRSVLRGALLLSLAGIVCKVLGAAYRIPLVRLIGDEGIGLYQMAYPVYLVFMALSTAGMPLAISKLVAERAALADFAGARRVLRLALGILGGLGLLGGVVMAGGARFFSLHIAADPRAYPVILSLAPAVPLMALMAALRGYFQGGQDMMPSALSQLVEQVVRVATLLALAVLLLPLGIGRAAAGAAFGACAGGAAGFAFLVWWYLAHQWPSPRAGRMAAAPSYARLAVRLGRLALPIAAGALLLPLMQVMDSILVPTRLQAIGYAVGEATAAVGRLGNAWAVIYVPNTVAAALAISLVPAVTEAWTRGERQVALGRIVQSLRAAAVICLPAAGGLWVLAREICRVLYGTASAAGLLAVLAPAAFFLGLQSVCAGALQGIGRTVSPVRNFALGFLLKVAVTGILCASPGFGPRGAGLGTVAGSALAAALNLVELSRRVGLPAGVHAALAKSAAATAAMVLSLCWLGSSGPLASMHAFARLAVMLPAGTIVFGLAFWLVGGVQAGDVEVLERLAAGRLLGRARCR